MENIKAILADCDGTVIENGIITNYSKNLPCVINETRKRGIAFSFASGRDYDYLKRLHNLLIKDSDIPHALGKEGIIFECGGVKLINQPEKYLFGCLDEFQVARIKTFFEKQNPLLLEGLCKLHDDASTTVVSWVTQEFNRGKPTNQLTLERQYRMIKPLVEQKFPYAQVVKTGDAIDIEGKGLSKKRSVVEYSKLTGIDLSQLVAIGDSANDWGLFEAIGGAGGLVIYVGINEEQRNKVKKEFKNNLIPSATGSEGTVQGIEHILNNMKR